ncbi:hypothetical protein LBMAG49_07150 [Planctomycetota bacterium]|nr:hypothetical protein LBMAG49_07150 [Planctomycetota bacterium]
MVIEVTVIAMQAVHRDAVMLILIKPNLGPRLYAAGQHLRIDAMGALQLREVVHIRLATAAGLRRKLMDDVKNVHGAQMLAGTGGQSNPKPHAGTA